MILSVHDLRTWFHTEVGPAMAVDGLSFDVAQGETVALVGESGSGKSATALSIMGLLPSTAWHPSGEIIFEDQSVLSLSPRARRRLCGASIGMVFQDPMSSLNPIARIGRQVAESVRLHTRCGRRAAQAHAVALLDEVGLPDPVRAATAYPHELSGGMRQRALIAIALAGAPRLLIADEPTTALDATVQRHILELLRGLQRARGMALLLVTHDLEVVAHVADRVVVMYAGQAVETGPTHAVFDDPRHPYTRGLLQARPKLQGPKTKLTPIPGQVPSATAPPPGCRFHPRCPKATAQCAEVAPTLTSITRRRRAACHLLSATAAPGSA